jgi:uncharacterized protein Veg
VGQKADSLESFQQTLQKMGNGLSLIVVGMCHEHIDISTIGPLAAKRAAYLELQFWIQSAGFRFDKLKELSYLVSRNSFVEIFVELDSHLLNSVQMWTLVGRKRFIFQLGAQRFDVGNSVFVVKLDRSLWANLLNLHQAMDLRLVSAVSPTNPQMNESSNRETHQLGGEDHFDPFRLVQASRFQEFRRFSWQSSHQRRQVWQLPCRCSIFAVKVEWQTKMKRQFGRTKIKIQTQGWRRSLPRLSYMPCGECRRRCSFLRYQAPPKFVSHPN